MRGLSVRDVEAALAEALGSDATVSKSTVSRMCEAIKEESDAFRARDLSGIELDYLFLDGSQFRMHPGGPAEPVLVAGGFNTPPASSSSWGPEPGNAESTDAWAGFPAGLLGRGLRSPLLVVSDGGAGLIGAVELVRPDSLRQRCPGAPSQKHPGMPRHAQGQVMAEFWAIWDDIDASPGAAAVAVASRRAKAFSTKWAKLYPAAVACLNDGIEHLTTHCPSPASTGGGCGSPTSSNTFGELRRRVKVIGQLPGERSSCRWCGRCSIEPAGDGASGDETPRVRIVQDLRRQLLPTSPTELPESIPEAVVPAA